MPDVPPQWTVAILVAAPLLASEIILALIVARTAAWCTRR